MYIYNSPRLGKAKGKGKGSSQYFQDRDGNQQRILGGSSELFLDIQDDAPTENQPGQPAQGLRPNQGSNGPDYYLAGDVDLRGQPPSQAGSGSTLPGQHSPGAYS